MTTVLAYDRNPIATASKSHGRFYMFIKAKSSNQAVDATERLATARQ